MLAPRAWRHGIVLVAGCGLLATVWLHLPLQTARADEDLIEKKPAGKGAIGKDTAEELAEPAEGILVMRTGAVVNGKIMRTGELYRIYSPFGQFHVPVELVKLHCASLEEAYDKLRETAQSHKSANAQITLARWCMTNHLERHAREELHEALVLEPNRQDARRLLQELDEASQPKPKDATAARPAAPLRDHLPTATDDEAVTLGGLSREQALQFVRRIQPLLVNSCAAAGCHSRESQSGFRLQHVSPGAKSNRNASERNLAQILEHIDLKKPRSSTILTVPRRSHGRKGRPIFSGPRGDEQFAELEKWIDALARDEAQRGQHDARRKSGAERTAALPRDESRLAAGGRSAATVGKQSADTDPFARRADDASNAQAPLPASTADPFDPAGFNRANSRANGR